MDLVTILKIVSIILGFICSTLIPLGIALDKARKAKKEATTEAEREAANNDMLIYVQQLIKGAEDLYKQVDTLSKANGLGSLGSIKKDNVMTKLHAYAIDMGYDFDETYWSATIDEIVTLTREVNAK